MNLPAVSEIRLEPRVKHGTYGFYSISIKHVNTVKKRERKKNRDQQISPRFSTSLLVLRLLKWRQTEEGRLHLLHLFSKRYIDHHIHLQSFRVHVEAEVNGMWLC